MVPKEILTAIWEDRLALNPTRNQVIHVLSVILLVWIHTCLLAQPLVGIDMDAYRQNTPTQAKAPTFGCAC
jgi:hypothetical protein